MSQGHEIGSTHPFSFHGVFHLGAQAFAAHRRLFLAVVGTLALLWIALEGITIGGDRAGLGLTYKVLTHLIYLIVFSGLELGLGKIALDMVDGTSPSYRDLFSRLHRGPAFLLAKLTYLGIVLTGLVLLIVPGMVWAARYVFTAIAMAENDRGIQESFQLSAEFTRVNRLRLLGFVFQLFLLNLVGLALLGVGLIATLPISVVAVAALYRRAQGRHPVAPSLNPGLSSPQPVPLDRTG